MQYTIGSDFVKNKAFNILTLFGCMFLAVTFILYALGGTVISDGGGLFVTIAALIFSVLPPCFYPVLKKIKYFKTMQTIYTALLLIFAISFTVFCVFVLSGYDGELSVNEDEEILLVCGCKTDGYTPTPKLQSRLDAAYKILSENPDLVCILSGGMGEDEGGVSEADSMKKYLVDRGIDGERLITEDKSRNTVENIKNSLLVMKENGLEGKKTVLLSSDFHAVRVGIIADRFGMNGRAIGAPSPDNLFSSLVREFMSYIKYFVFNQS